MANLPINANLEMVISNVKDSIFSNLNCHNIGRITAYDNVSNTVTVEIMQQKEWYGRVFEPTIITDVPIVTFGTKTVRIMPPDIVGSYCILLFMDRNIDNFMATGVAQLPATERMHSVTDCIALLTIDTNVDTVPMYDKDALTLSNNTTYIKLFADKLQFANATQNLATLIQSFLAACENITVDTQTGALTPDSKQAFTDLKTNFEELLK